MEEKITVEQALEMTMKQLGAISIPVGLIEQIGIPINKAIHNIGACLEAMQKNAQEAKQEEPEETTEE